MVRVLVSACLLGEKVRYNGGDSASAHPILATWIAEGRVVPFCPEVAGGLGVPRPAAEIVGGDGGSVLTGAARIVTRDAADVTEAFRRGADLALNAAREAGARVAVLKDGSPSCGSSYIYDGTFSGRRTAGQGTTAAQLERAGIRVFSEAQLDEAAACVEDLEA